MDLALSFFHENWGNVASVVALFLTFYFSVSAARSSVRANNAVIAAKQRLTSVDALVELNRLIGRTDDLLFRLESGSWVVVVERATELRISIATMLSRTDTFFSSETEKRLGEAVVLFKNLASLSDRVVHSSAKLPDVAKYRRIVLDQKETLALAAEEFRSIVGDKHDV